MWRVLFREKNFKWLPNTLTTLRFVLAVLVYAAAVRGQWTAGCVLMALALISDFFDGLAAKKLHAETVIGGYMDSIVDFVLATSGVLGLIIGADVLPAWSLLIVAPVCLVIGYIRFFVPKTSRQYMMLPVLSLPLLFSAWTFISWGYLTEAFGWLWIYVPTTIGILIILASLKRHRLRAWFGWLVASHRQRS